MAQVQGRKHRDPNTLSNYHQWRAAHVANEFTIDFDNKRVHGTTELTIKRLAESDTIVLDTNHLHIKHVRISGELARFNIGEKTDFYGSPLNIHVPAAAAVELQVKITFHTTAECQSLQWLEPTQTDSGKYPYMFSQCQAIHARSMFPCFDTPDAKATYDFKIHSILPVMASGIPLDVTDTAGSVNGQRTYTFKQSVPIPAYLFALASGEVETAKVGPRSTVYASPSMIAASKWELEEHTEKFIQTAEKLISPYVWGQYNMLILPGSFPFGGMENPTMTYLSPTVVSGDRQSVNVVAHELSHSWSGNLVTSASWEHFWLNEGWTTYLERRIDGILHGKKFEDFAYVLGWKALRSAVEGFGQDHAATQLIIDHKGKDPDELFSVVPYEKGSVFLKYLEEKVGREKWDSFIPHYFTKWNGLSLDSFEFKDEVFSFFTDDAQATAQLQSIDWHERFYKPGYPPALDLDSSLSDICDDLANKWKSLANNSSTITSSTPDWSPSATDVRDMDANQIVVFLDTLIDAAPALTPTQIEQMGSTYDLTTSTNVEVSSRYFVLGLNAGTKSLREPTAEILSRVGRIKFTRRLYASLVRCDAEFAKTTFEKHRAFYHPICRALVEKVVYDAEYKGPVD